MSNTVPIPGRIEETHKPYQVVAPPKEFFRQFANLAHNRVLNEDFPHEKHLTLKYKGTGANFVANAKGSISIKSESKKTEEVTADGKKNEVYQIVDSYPTSSEFKLLTAFNETSTETRFNSKGIVKVWTNWGVHKVGEPIEFISGLKGDTQFTKSKAWVAGLYSRGHVASGTRVQVRREKGFAFSLAQKLTYTHKDLWCGGYVDVNLTDLKVSHCNGIVGYNVNKNIHFYAEHSSCKSCVKPAAATTEKKVETTTTVTEKTVTTEKVNGPADQKTTVTVESKTEEHVPLLKKIGFGKGTFTGVYKDANIFALGQVGWEEPTEKFTFEAGAVYTINSNSSVRAKVNQDFDLTVGGRHKLHKNISLNVGTSIPLKTPEKFYNAAKTIPIPFGASLEFNF